MKIKISGLNKTINLIESMENGSNKNVNNFCKKQISNVVETASYYARYKFVASDYAGVKDISVSSPKWEGNTISFNAEGESVLFVEFGTGINYDDLNYGSNYPREKTSPVFIRGTYGKGKGSNESWVFVSRFDITSIGTRFLATKKDGRFVYRTKGNESAKAMLGAYNLILDAFKR